MNAQNTKLDLYRYCGRKINLQAYQTLKRACDTGTVSPAEIKCAMRSFGARTTRAGELYALPMSLAARRICSALIAGEVGAAGFGIGAALGQAATGIQSQCTLAGACVLALLAVQALAFTWRVGPERDKAAKVLMRAGIAIRGKGTASNAAPDQAVASHS